MNHFLRFCTFGYVCHGLQYVIAGLEMDLDNPGPCDASVLTEQVLHVSSTIWDGEVCFTKWIFTFLVYLLSFFRTFHWMVCYLESVCLIFQGPGRVKMSRAHKGT